MVVYFICGPGCPMSYDEVEKIAKRFKLELVGEHAERRFAKTYQLAEKDCWMIRTVWGIDFGKRYFIDFDGQFYYKSDDGKMTLINGYYEVLQLDEGDGQHPPVFVQSLEKRFFKTNFVIQSKGGGKNVKKVFH